MAKKKAKRSKKPARRSGREPAKKVRPKAVGKPPKKSGFSLGRRAESYGHPDATSPMRPDVGTQAQFKKKKPPATYRYDSSLSPELGWDGSPAREQGEALIAAIQGAKSLEDAKAAAADLKAMSRPFLNWAGKAERQSFDVPTLPLFVHERLSTKAIIETLTGHKRDQQVSLFDLFADPRHPVADQVLRAYEHRDRWVNRLILGDSLVVMNSLLCYEGLGGQVQMIYMDPPYGVKFGQNFQPFVRRRGSPVNNDDEHVSREPELVKAYRDTWELGLHSYLAYMRDRLLLSRDLLHPSGSIFVQIGDENVHHVRELLDEVFGEENFCSIIAFTKAAGGLESVSRVSSRLDYLLWYCRDHARMRYVPIYESRGDAAEAGFDMVELPNGTRRRLTRDERVGSRDLPDGSRLFMSVLMTKPGPGSKFEVEHEGRTYDSGKRWWGTTREGIQEVIRQNRVVATARSLRYVKYFEDFPFRSLSNLWSGLGGAADPVYVVQTSPAVIRRCILMTTAPGDLVLDPTCGSGTTAYVAEQWGRRWISVDVSRVPLALARERLLTATYEWYDLTDESRGPSAGFVYHSSETSNNPRSIGPGVVSKVTMKSIANNEPPDPVVLVDRPERSSKTTRVTGPFWFEATIPTPVDWEGDGIEDSGTGEEHSTFVDRMIEVLRRSPVLMVGGGRKVTLKNVRPPAKTLALSAEAIMANGGDRPAAILFGPENGAVSEKLIYEAAREAHAKSYGHLYVIGFAIQPEGRKLVEECEKVVGVPATYVQATPDIMMGDLLKNMRSSQIFSVCGLPEVKLKKLKAKKGEMQKYQAELLGLDVFDPITMETDHRDGDDVPAWLLDTDYNGLCFHVNQAFFPRTGAWERLKKALKGDYDETVWDHLAGTKSAPFEAGEHGEIAVKVIDDRGNELLVVKSIKEAE